MKCTAVCLFLLLALPALGQAPAPPKVSQSVDALGARISAVEAAVAKLPAPTPPVAIAPDLDALLAAKIDALSARLDVLTVALAAKLLPAPVAPVPAAVAPVPRPAPALPSPAAKPSAATVAPGQTYAFTIDVSRP